MSGKKPKINSKRVILFRAYIVFGMICLFGLWITTAAIKLNFGAGSKLRAQGKEQRTRVVDVKAIRGSIFASDGSLLATSVPRYDLVFDALADGLSPEIFKKHVDSLALLLSQKFPQKNTSVWLNELWNARKKRIRYAILLKDLGFDQVKEMRQWPLISLGRFKGGFWYEEHTKRIYFLGELARRSIGYTKEGVSVGLEGAFDTLLKGKDGKRLEKRESGNVWRPVNADNFEDPQNGMDIITTLDVNLQDVAQYALQRVLAANGADHGCAVVMEVSTGAIKAMANLKLDPKTGSYNEAQNFAVDEFSEPGSTFKLMAALALLDDGLAKATDSVDVGNGEFMFSDRRMKDASPPTKRIYTLQESFEKSSNVGISKLVAKHYGKNPSKFTDRLFDLGLNIKPDFDIRSSNNPRIKTPKSKDWYKTTLPWMSIGYEIKVSPLQILSLYNAIANNGKLMKPYMVSEIRNGGQIIKKIEPEVLKESICKPETLIALKAMMEGVVDHGTATNIKNENYTVAGKTGTAQIAKGTAGYDKSSYKASFVGYFPANNPQYTCIVVINEPRKGAYYGALVAGPVFKEIADKIYSTSWRLHPGLTRNAIPSIPSALPGNTAHLKTVFNSLGISARPDSNSMGALWSEAVKAETYIKLKQLKNEGKGVPNLKGLGIRDALYLLENKGYKVTFEGFGHVTSWSLGSPPEPGALPSIHLILNP